MKLKHKRQITPYFDFLRIVMPNINFNLVLYFEFIGNIKKGNPCNFK
jgi:hypothetical protein